jgi:hypothetical protein
VRCVGIHIADGDEVDLALGDRLGDFTDRLDLRRRQAEPFELVGARLAQRVVVEWIERREQPGANRSGRRGRELLPANDGAQAGKARFAPAQAEGAGLLGDRRKTRVGEDQLG